MYTAFKTTCVQRRMRVGLVVLAALLASSVLRPVWALTQMSDSEMATVSGRDGLQLDFDAAAGQSLGADEFRWTNDAGTANEGALALRTVDLEAPGTNPVTVKLDSGSTASAGGSPGVLLDATWDELGFTSQALTLRDTSGSLVGNSGGEIGFFSSGGLAIFNQGGLFNRNSNNARVDLQFSTESAPGDFILRQGGPGEPEFSFGNANLRLVTKNCDTGKCTLGINNSEMFLRADLVDLALNFELLFKNNPTDFDRGDPTDPTNVGGRKELIRFGWTGGLEDFDLSVGSGSIAGSQGLQIDTAFNYASDFSLILGQSGVDSPRAVFNDFVELPGHGNATAFSLPLTVDVVPGGTSLGSLCFGNTPGAACSGTGEELVSLPVDRQALAVQIRDGRLRAYNNLTDVVDPAAGGDSALVDDPADTETFNWSLGYTYGRLDSNIALYPGFDSNQDGMLNSTGVTADVNFSLDSPGFWNEVQNQGSFPNPGSGGDWSRNTHFFIADTNSSVAGGSPFAFGLINADLLWRTDDLAIRVAENSDTAFSGLDGRSDIPTGGIDFDGGLWLQSSNGIRYQFRGILGGGGLQDSLAFDSLAKISLANVRLDTDRFVFALSPFTGAGPEGIAFEGLLDFNNQTFVSLAEPSDPAAEVKLDKLRGRVMWRNGKVEVSSSADNPDNRPALTIRNDLLIGSTAAGGAPLRADLTFGDSNTGGGNLGEAAIPSGQFYSEIQLKPQN